MRREVKYGSLLTINIREVERINEVADLAGGS